MRSAVPVEMSHGNETDWQLDICEVNHTDGGDDDGNIPMELNHLATRQQTAMINLYQTTLYIVF